MKKAILAVLVLVCFAVSCVSDEKSDKISDQISDQIRIVFRALEKCNSMSTSAITDDRNFLEAIEIAYAEAEHLYRIDKNQCSTALMRISGQYKLAGIQLRAKYLENYNEYIREARDELNGAYDVCYPKKKK